MLAEDSLCRRANRKSGQCPSKQILDLFLALNRDMGQTILTVTHELEKSDRARIRCNLSLRNMPQGLDARHQSRLQS
ncbi:MAG: hypothetical protein EF813_11680 [Methanosarcinales archaeon]|nr:MAG: hypothetical protein EF813_11680 [Methanosarcinales archaeon]